MTAWRNTAVVVTAAVSIASGSLLGVSTAQATPTTPPTPPIASTATNLADLAIDVRPDTTAEPAVPEFGPTIGAEVTITGAAAWHAANIDGSGVKIGVIDFFDVTKFWNVAEHGPTPIAGVTARCLDAGSDCTGEFFDGVDKGSDDHGVAVVELIKDMAPGAEIYIARALTTTDYRTIVDWFASAGVTIINRSLGSRYDGPGDGRGGLDEVAAYANSKGIAWINSAGNNGRDRYYRHAVRLVGEGPVRNVAFGPTGSEIFLKFNGCTSLGGVRWANDWDKPASRRTDYDVYLWRSPIGDPAGGTVIASSTAGQRRGAAPIENIADDLCPEPAATTSLYLEVRWLGGDVDGDVLEILDYGQGMTAFTQTEQSATTAISDSKELGVLAVGAIDPADRGAIATYSSQGPTNDGRIAPDIAAPANFTSSVRGRFAGTSAASAVVAGGAALLLDGNVAVDPTSLGSILRHIAIDRGAPGPDNAYGHGEFRLPPPPAAIDATPSRFVALDAPRRVLDTRPESAVGPPALIGALASGDLRELPVLGQAGVPASGVTAVAINLTVVDLDRPAYVQALPTWRATVGGYSNVNTDLAGQTRPNFAIVPVGDRGSISLFSIAGGHLVVDVLGYFEATDGPVAAGRFVELSTPERVLDTRVDAPAGGPVAPVGGRVARSVPWPSGIDRAGVSALVVTVTGTEATQPGWIQAFPAGRTEVIGTTSTVNLVPGTAVANAAIVPVGTDGMAVTGSFGMGTSHVVVDVVGYITSTGAPASEAGLFVPVRPARAFDTRTGVGELTVAQEVVIDASDAPGVEIPSTASGVVWNFAALSVRQPGFGRAWAADAPKPVTSSFNWSLVGETRAAAVITAVDGGRSRVVLDNGSGLPTSLVGGLIADVFGYFT